MIPIKPPRRFYRRRKNVLAARESFALVHTLPCGSWGPRQRNFSEASFFVTHTATSPLLTASRKKATDKLQKEKKKKRKKKEKGKTVGETETVKHEKRIGEKEEKRAGKKE